MNRFISTSLLVLTAILLFVKCNKPEAKLQTIENLKTAYKQEITRSAQYAACAQKTREERMERLSVLFLTTSKARHICADNYKTTLEEFGITVDTTVGSFDVKSTIENLLVAIEHETHNFKTLYPEFAETANDAKATQAEQLFTWQQELGRRDVLYFNDAIQAIDQKMTNAFYTFYLVCPRCGNIYYPHQVEDECAICKTKKEKFIPQG